MDLKYILSELQIGNSQGFTELREIADKNPEFLLSLKDNISQRVIPDFSSDLFEYFYLSIYNMTQIKRRHHLIRSYLDLSYCLVDIIISYELNFTGTVLNQFTIPHKITKILYYQNRLFAYSSQGNISSYTLQGKLKFCTRCSPIFHFTSGGRFSRIDIRNLHNGECISDFGTWYPASYAYSENKIIIGDDYGVIRIYDSEAGNEERDIRVSTTDITALLPLKNRIFSGDRYGEIKEWDLLNDLLTPLHFNHNRRINFIKLINENTIITGSNDGTLKFFDLQSRIVIRSIELPDMPYDVLINKDKLIVRSGSDSYYVIDDQNTIKLFSHRNLLSGDLFYDNFFISYSIYGLIIWNIDTLEKEKEISISIDSLAVLPNKRIAISYNNNITILEWVGTYTEIIRIP